MDDPFERSPNAAQYNQTELFSKGWRIRRSLLEDGTLMKYGLVPPRKEAPNGLFHPLVSD